MNNRSIIKTIAISFCLVSLLVLTGQSCTIFSKAPRNDGGIFRSDDQGLTWVQKTMIGVVKKKTLTISNVSAGIILFHPSDKSTIYLGTMGNGIYRTEDAGERWQVTGRQTGNVTALAIDPVSPAILYAGNGGNIEKTIDGGVTWENVFTESRAGISLTSILIDPSDSGHIFASNSGGVILESRDYGKNWLTNNIFKIGVQRLIQNPADRLSILAVHINRGLSRTDDGGTTWIDLSAQFKKFAGSEQVFDASFTNSEKPILYLATAYGLFRTADLGQTIEYVTTLIPAKTLQIRTVQIDHANSDNIFISTTNKIHISKDGGISWKVISVPTGRLINLLSVNPRNAQQLFLGTLVVKK